MSLAERLKAMLVEKGYSQGELARRVGVTQGTIYKLVAGHAKSSKRLVEIAQSLGVRAEWLLTGNGPQYIDESDVLNHTAHGHDLGHNPESVEFYDRDSPSHDGEIEIPLLTDIDSAFSIFPFPFTSYNGPTMLLNREDMKEYGVNINPSDFVAFSVTGDSMDPVLPEGSKVILNVNDRKIIDGKIYALDQSSWRKLRILFRSGPAELTMRSFNSERYPDEKIAMNDVEVLGRIVYSQRGM
jgi:Predicted transcriptional regulator